MADLTFQDIIEILNKERQSTATFAGKSSDADTVKEAINAITLSSIEQTSILKQLAGLEYSATSPIQQQILNQNVLSEHIAEQTSILKQILDLNQRSFQKNERKEVLSGAVISPVPQQILKQESTSEQTNTLKQSTLSEQTNTFSKQSTLSEQTSILKQILDVNQSSLSGHIAEQTSILKQLVGLESNSVLSEQTSILKQESISENIAEQTSILKQILDLNQRVFEEDKRKEALSSVGRTVGIQTVPTDTDTSPTPNTNTDRSGGIQSIGLLARAAAMAIGTALGVIQGQLKAIAFVFPQIATTLSDLTKNLSNTFTQFSSSVRSTLRSITGVFDDVFKWTKTAFSFEGSSLSKVIDSVKTGVNYLIKPFSDLVAVVDDLSKGPINTIKNTFDSITTAIKSFGSIVKGIATTVAKVFYPLTILITAFDTIKGAIEGYAEGGFLGAFQGAIDGFFNSLITMPLDFVKDMGAWLVRQLGFDETADWLNEFSFTDLFKSFTSAIFDGIKSVFEWVGTLFTDPVEALKQLWNSYMGAASGLLDILLLPINKTFDWISKKFVWRDEDAPEFSLRELIEGWIEDFETWVSEIFSFFPSIDDVVSSLMSSLPSWMRPETTQELRERLSSNLESSISARESAPYRSDLNFAQRQWTKTKEDYDAEIEDTQRRLSELPMYRTGSRGFMDFGPGTPAVLHGIEAIVPRNTPAGEMLARNFDENWQSKARDPRRIDKVQSAALSEIVKSIVIAPVNSSPVTVYNGGSSVNNSSSNIVISGNGDNPTALPGGAL